jgi:hypothetical protein
MVVAITSAGLLPGCGRAQDGGSDGPSLDQELAQFDPNNFDRSTQIDNPFMPMKPGMRFVYEGTTVEDDGSLLPHRVEIHVTDLTKVIGGIRTVVTWDLDYGDDQLVEAELAFFAQDNDGNVWRMGEYPEEYEDGELVAAPAWIHGFEEARAGFMMRRSHSLERPAIHKGGGRRSTGRTAVRSTRWARRPVFPWNATRTSW